MILTNLNNLLFFLPNFNQLTLSNLISNIILQRFLNIKSLLNLSLFLNIILIS